MSKPSIVLLPDAGPLITLAYADALDLLFRPGWSVQLVDIVWHEVTRNQTPTSEKIRQWVTACLPCQSCPPEFFSTIASGWLGQPQKNPILANFPYRKS